jgi:hypothetical protein
MKYVKGVLVTQDSNVLLEIPKDWRIKLGADRFILCKNAAGNETAYNTAHIVSIGEIDEQIYKNALTRMEMERQEAMKKAGVEDNPKKEK